MDSSSVGAMEYSRAQSRSFHCFRYAHTHPLSLHRANLVIGESLSLYEEGDKKWAIMTPFAHPGDKIKAKICKHDRFFSSADLVEILDYSEEFRGGEGDRRVNPEGGCKYFGEW